METKTFWVGDRPGGSWIFQVLNQKTGAPESLLSFPKARVVLLDTDNREVEIPEVNTNVSNPTDGTVVFTWPSESLFNKPGRYVMQLELIGELATRRTTVQEIIVKKIGGVSR